jgi:hypothetical protein
MNTGKTVLLLALIIAPAVIGARRSTGQSDTVDQTRHPLGAARSVWDSVFTAEQAKRGEAVYRQICTRCHTATLVGANDSPALTGSGFLANWNGFTVADLHDRVLTTMPSDSVGTLTAPQVTDVLTYIFSFNGFPAGKSELASVVDSMKAIQIVAAKP